MKKFVVLMLAATLALSFASCGGDAADTTVAGTDAATAAATDAATDAATVADSEAADSAE